MIKGKKVNLRPVERDDLPLLEEWNNDIDYSSEWNSFGLKPTGKTEQHFNEDGMLSPRSGTLMVVDLEGNLAGTISYRINMFAPNDGSKGYDIGISLHKDYRGKGYGAEAQRLITEYLFETYPVVRVSASTDVNNIAEQRSLEKAGFKREGVLRQIMWRKGAYRDMVVYSLLRHEL